jgi:chaperone BCS1
MVQKEQKELEQAQNIGAMLYDSYTITGIFAHKKILNLCKDVMKYKDNTNNEDTFELYLNDEYRWSRSGTIKGRTKDSVIMSNNTKELLYNDMSEFLGSKQWYHERGISYKRGYLFHGKPGTGKSSLIKALATINNSKLYYLDLSIKKLEDSNLNKLFSNMSGGNIMIIIEDIDAIFEGRKNISKSNVTFSGLLNCLDGLCSKPGLITIITTNHIDKLDPALIRTGRVDLKIKLDYPELEQINEYYKLFYNKEPNLQIENIKRISMSDIQEICIKNKHNSELALEEIKKEITNQEN